MIPLYQPGDRKTLTIELTRDEWNRLAVAAIEEGVSLESYVNGLLSAHASLKLFPGSL